jgi:cell division protein FtsL
MKKILVIIFIFLLIFSTAIIKNSTKKIEDEIFAVKESLRVSENELGDTRLEFEYLSSTEKLLEYQLKYFEKELINKDINSIKTLIKKSNGLFISDLNTFEINEKE